MSLTIQRLGHLGDGIAEGPVFVPRTLPGEVVDGEIVDGRVESPRILTPSVARVTAPCPHYKGCGGCALMHASDDFVAAWKGEVVRQALAAQGLAAPEARVITVPEESRRRATFSGRRLKSGPVVGFHARASDTVIAVPDCRVMRPELRRAREACADLTGMLGSRKGEVRIAVTLSEAGLDLDVSGGRALGEEDRGALAGLAERHDLARLAHGGETVIERRPPVQLFDGLPVVPPPGAFLQATAEGEAALRRFVLDAVGPAGRVADLFAGCGTFSLPLARGAEVLAVEGAGGHLAALDRGWRHGVGLKRVRTERRDLFRRPLGSDELAAFDAVVLDPPRAGAEAQAAALAASGVPRIVYVSCHSVSFARDAKLLAAGGYRFDALVVVDQFRWSPHIELAASFGRAHMPG